MEEKPDPHAIVKILGSENNLRIVLACLLVVIITETILFPIIVTLSPQVAITLRTVSFFVVVMGACFTIYRVIVFLVKKL